MAQIPVAHVNIQGISCIVFDADARDRSPGARSHLLNSLTQLAMRNGLAVSKRALAYANCGRVEFYGDPDLVRWLANNGMPTPTHTLTT